MLCKCNKGTDNSRKEMDKFNIYDLSEHTNDASK